MNGAARVESKQSCLRQVGAVLGLEYMSAGLLAAAVTHWLYDWLAFELQFWLPICSEQHAAQRTVGTH